MGLDMFLFRLKEDGEIENEVFYWRKAYPIMDWFENRFNGIENLKDYPVSREDMVELEKYCSRIINDNHFHAMDDLRVVGWTTQYELDEWKDWHMDYVKSTKKFLDDFLKDNEDWDNIIFKGWW